MSITVQALEAFRNKGFRVDSRIKGKEAKKVVSFKNAVFSGYAMLDDFTDMIQSFICKGCIVQNHIKGYLLFSFPENQPDLLNSFKHDLHESGNHLRFIGYSDTLIIRGI